MFLLAPPTPLFRFLSFFLLRRTPPRREVNKIATERCPPKVGGGSGGGFSWLRGLFSSRLSLALRRVPVPVPVCGCRLHPLAAGWQLGKRKSRVSLQKTRTWCRSSRGWLPQRRFGLVGMIK